MRHSVVCRWIVIHSILLLVGFSGAEIPPSIVNFPTKDLDRANDVIKQFKIPCEAVGTPPFTWVWKKFHIDNRHSVEIDKITRTLFYAIWDNGLLTGTVFGSFMNGYYQCFVSNSAGTIFSRKIKVRVTTAGSFLTSSAITEDVTLGRSKIIKCPPRQKSFGESYEWGYKSSTDGFKYLGTKENRYISAEGDLIFSYLKQSDIDDVNNIGGLQCRVDAGTTVQYSPVISLNKVGDAYNGTTAPSFAVSLKGLYNATEGESIVLYCAAVGKPIPAIRWMKDNNTIVDGTNSYKISKQQSNRLLKIENVDKKVHEGQYQCTATSDISASGETSSANLVVKVHPNITSYPGINVTAMYGETMMLWCNVSGDPLPDVSWWMNGKRLQASERITLSAGTVEIRQMGVVDAGCYQCVAENDLSMVVSQTHVQLKGKQPTFSERTRVIKVFRGRNATLYCNPRGIPSPVISWIKDNNTIDVTQPNNRFSNDSTDSLHIKEVLDGDERAISCKATNIFGEAQLMWNLQLLNNTVITQKVLNVQVDLGETAELQCKAGADASLSLLYKWIKDDKEIVYNKQVSWDEQKNVLRIEKVELINTGKYTCVAYTSKPYYSQDMATAVLSIKGIPEPPQNLKISNCTNLNATLTWQLGISLNTTITHLLIEEESSYNPGIFYVKENITDPTRTSAKLHLTPYSKFTFRMKAFSGSRASRESQPTKSGECETKPTKPMIYPDNLRGESDGANTLKLLWNAIPPSKQNGPGFVYNLRLRKKGDLIWLHDIVFPPSVSYDARNAGVLTEWEFQVWGENQEGAGPMSPIAGAVSGQDRPPEIKNINLTKITKDSIHVVWRARHDGRIDGYKIYIGKIGKGNRTIISVTPASSCINTTCSYNVSELAAGTRYGIGVSAYNSRGPSSRIDMKAFVTLDVPKTPGGLQGKADEAGKLTITWNDLQSDEIGAAWRYYVLRWKRTNDTTWNTVNITDLASTSYTIQSAGCFVPWEFRILAVNEIGSSELSNRVVLYSRRCPPGKSPQGLKIVRRGQTSVELEWDAVSDSSVYGYKVYYKVNSNGVKTRRESSSKDWKKKEYKSSDVCIKEKCRVATTGLEAQTNYTMYVTSYNEVGEGPGSEMIVVKTNKIDELAYTAPSDPWWKKGWFIAVIVCLILLIILVLVCVICCCKRNKESGKGKYEVAKTSEKTKEATAV